VVKGCCSADYWFGCAIGMFVVSVMHLAEPLEPGGIATGAALCFGIAVFKAWRQTRTGAKQ
jgi:hypothetical protein